jgi:hypothetical protein
MNFLNRKLFFLLFFGALGASFLFAGEQEKEKPAICQQEQEALPDLLYLQQAALRLPTADQISNAQLQEQVPNGDVHQFVAASLFQSHLLKVYEDFASCVCSFRDFKENNLKHFEDKAMVQRLLVPDDAHIALLSDIHGNFHALVNIFCYWRDSMHVIDNNFKITRNNFYIVVLGDMVDRGLYNIEVLYMLMRLYLANPGHVVLLRGNHENSDMNERQHGDKFSLGDEIDLKFGDDSGDEEKPCIEEFDDAIYRWLPLSCYVHVNGKVIQCCHATPDILYDPRAFLNSDDLYACAQLNGSVDNLSDDAKKAFYLKIAQMSRTASWNALCQKLPEVINSNLGLINCILRVNNPSVPPSICEFLRSLKLYYEGMRDKHFPCSVQDIYDYQKRLYSFFLGKDFQQFISSCDKDFINRVMMIYSNFVQPQFRKFDELNRSYISAGLAENSADIEAFVKQIQLDSLSYVRERNTLSSWSMLWSDVDVPGDVVFNPGRGNLQYSQAMMSHMLRQYGIFAVCRGHQHNGRMFELLAMHGGIAGLWNVDNTLPVLPVAQDSVFTFYSQHGEGSFGLLYCRNNGLCIKKYTMPSLNRLRDVSRVPLVDYAGVH